MAHLAATQTECSDSSSELIQLLLDFALNSDEDGTGSLKIREINRMAIISHILNTPSYVEGIIYLHGRALPIISLRQKNGRISHTLDSALYDSGSLG